MAGASLADYEAAFRKADGKGVLPESALANSRPVGVRPAWMPDEKQPEPTPQDRVRETADAFWKLNNYAFIACPCGARLKIPPQFHGDSVRCPRCQKVHEVAAPSGPAQDKK